MIAGWIIVAAGLAAAPEGVESVTSAPAESGLVPAAEEDDEVEATEAPREAEDPGLESSAGGEEAVDGIESTELESAGDDEDAGTADAEGLAEEPVPAENDGPAADAAPPVDDEHPPILEEPGQERAEDDMLPSGPVRRGFVVSLLAGYAGCAKEWCRGYRGGFGGGVELGLRFNRVMPVFAWTGGVGPYDKETLSEEVGLEVSGSPLVRTHVFGLGVSLFPLGKGGERRVDPHFGLRLGYGTVKLEYGDGTVSVFERVSRGVATLGGGLDGFVTDNLSLGIRVDAQIMFGGEYCFTVSEDGRSAGSCTESDDAESRADPRDWPLPFAVSAQLRYIWGFPR